MTITLTREEAQSVLDALGKVFDHNDWQSYETTVDLLRARLSAPEPEPSAWAVQEGDNLHDVFLFKDEADEMCHLKGDHAKAIPLYTSRLSAPEPEPVAGYRWEEGRTPPSVTFTAPPQREWQGLTAYEIQELHLDNTDWGNFACAIEAKLREKNSEP